MDEDFMFAVYGMTYDDLYDCKNCLCRKCIKCGAGLCYANCYLGAPACVTYSCKDLENFKMLNLDVRSTE